MANCASWSWETTNDAAPAGDWDGTHIGTPGWAQVVLDNAIVKEGTGSYKHDNLHICPVGTSSAYVYKQFATNGAYVTTKAWFRLGGLDTNNPGADFESILAICVDNDPPNADPETWSVWFTVDVYTGANVGKLRVNGWPGTIGPSADALALNTWYEIQLDIYESATGWWKLYVDDVLWLEDTGDTRAWGVTYDNRMLATGIYAPLCDTTGNDDVWVDDARWYQGYVACPTTVPAPAPAHPTPAHGGQARHTYTLTLKPSVLSTVGSVASLDLTDLARDWSRTTRLQGGYWTGTFTMPYGKRALDAFDTWLGCHVEERSGGAVSWEGMVYEMELSDGGLVRRRSLDTMVNRVKATYTDLFNVAQETAWVDNTASQARYGVKEEIIDVGVVIDVTADALRDRYLQEHGWPWPKPASFSRTQERKLTVTVNGYSFPMNWLYSTLDEYIEALAAGGPYGTFTLCPAAPGADTPCTCAAPGSPAFEDSLASFATWTPYGVVPPADADYSMWITADISGNKSYGYIGEVTTADPAGGGGFMTYVHLYKVQDFDPLVPGDHGYNGTAPGGGVGAEEYWVRGSMSAWVRGVANALAFLQPGVIDENDLPVKRDTDTVRYWDALYNKVLSDVDGHPWRLWVSAGRYLNYQQISTTPRWLYRAGQFLDMSERPVNPWQLTPGVVRRLDGGYTPPQADSWLTDRRDFLMDEVQVDAAGMVTPHIADVDTAELMIYELARRNEGLASTPPAPSQGGPYPPNWNVEAGVMNPIGPEVQDGVWLGEARYHGYWAPKPGGGYTWITDWSIDLHPYY